MAEASRHHSHSAAAIPGVAAGVSMAVLDMARSKLAGRLAPLANISDLQVGRRDACPAQALGRHAAGACRASEGET
jgi:hypothetical protein